jgi:hypothetical protein
MQQLKEKLAVMAAVPREGGCAWRSTRPPPDLTLVSFTDM